MKEEQQEQKLYNVSITPNDHNGIGLNFEAGILLQHYNEDNSIIFVLKSPKKKTQSDDLEFTNTGSKESQKELIKEIMDLDAKDGLYEISDEKIFNAAKECRFEDLDISVGSFELGAKWYRKQLKKKK
jgi:hypothetical protein